MLLNLLITLITCCIRQIENPSHSFNFLPANIALCRVDCARRPLSGAGWLKENHPRFAAVFFRQALHNQGKRQTDAYKKRNTGFTKAGHV